MKFLDEIMDKTAKFADEAVKVGKEAFEQTKVAAGEAVEKGKKKVNELQLESDLKDAYRRLGALVYSRHKSGEKDEEALARCLDAVEKAKTALDELKASGVNENSDYTVEDFKEDASEIVNNIVEEVKETISDVKEAAAKEDAAKEDDIKVCPSCGAKADEGDIFCRDCGEKLN